MVGTLVLTGFVFLIAFHLLRDTSFSKGLFAWIITIGAIIRFIMMTSTPILEDDFYRYLWDGGVLANGSNPYAYSPEEILNVKNDFDSVPPSLRRLAEESGPLIARVNHPHLRTIYPPVAQAFFSIAHYLGPWSLFTWRLVLLLFDSVTLCLLVVVLRRLRLPLLWCMLYWWNPLLVKEIFNSGHMDVLVLPFVLGAILLAARGGFIRAAFTLALATGVKIWPITLLPLLLRPVYKNLRVLVPAISLYGFVVSLLSVPILTSGLDPRSGFSAYGEYWEMNDALFMLIIWGTKLFSGLTGILADQERIASRLLVLAILTGWTVWVTLGEGPLDLEDLSKRSLMIVAALFLLSPTQFPWYYIWILPFLTINPRSSLLLLTALLPLYYLRFYFKAIDNIRAFDIGIVWIEYVPVWLLLIREWYVNRGRQQLPGVEVPA
jgi:hypothetical protein